MDCCVVSPDCGYGRHGLGWSWHFSASPCLIYLVLRMGQRTLSWSVKTLSVLPSVSVTVQTGKPLFTLKQCLAKMFAALNWRGSEMKPSEILIGVHIVSCFIFPSKYWALRLYSWKWGFELGFLVQNAFFDLLEWKLCVSFCGQLQLLKEPNGILTSSFLLLGRRLLLLAMLV